MIKVNNVSYINTIIEKTKFFSEKFGNVVIFTNGNCWYIPTLINNLLKSMQIHESSHKTIVFCSDKEGYDKCHELGFNHFEYVDIPELNISNILSGSSANTKDYTRLCFVKIVIMKHILDMGYTALYLDPDMAFLSPSVDNLLSYLDKDDFVCAGSIEYLNSNIMIAKPTDFNKKLFELTLEDFNSFLQEIGYGDEDLLRPRLINKSFSCVDRTHYPNGIDSIKYKNLNLAKIIHSNCVVGLDNKIKLMKECNGWFLETKKICSFTQTYNNNRNIIYKFKQYDDTDNYFRNKLDHNIYAFHGVDEKTAQTINNNPFLNKTQFEIFTYNGEIPYTQTYKQSLLKIKEKGYSYIVFLQDDVFSVNQLKKDWDDLFHIIQTEKFNLLNLETVHDSLENYKILYQKGNIKIYETMTSNKYLFGDYPFIGNIDYLLSEIYDEQYFNEPYLQKAEYDLSYRLKSVPSYSCNFQFYQRENLCGISNRENFPKNILRMEEKYTKINTNIISEEFVVDVKDIYPPFLEGDLFEKYFYEHIKKNNPKLNRKYINATWTNLYCNSLFKNIPFNNEKLQKELNSLPQEDKYFTIVQFDEGVKYNKLPPNTTVFGCCFGDIPIPLTYETTAFSNQKLKLWDDKSIFCSFLGGHTHILRNKVYEYVQQFPDYYYEIVSDLSVSKELYIQKSIESKFCLSARGFGRSSFRFFEILKLGSVPVYIWDDENWLPFKEKVDYSKLCVSINIKDLEKLDTILRNITKEEYEDMVFYYKKVENLFTYEGMSKEIIKIVNEYKPTICIVTIMIGDLSYKNKAKENHKKYCDKYGYSYVCIEDKINDFHPMWMKPDLILRELNKGYDYVFWMDADSFFINMDISFDLFLKNKHDLITAGDENDIVNTGHLLFKNTEWSIKFIEKWLGFRKPLNQSVFEKFKNITTHFYIKEDCVFFNDQPPINLLLGGADEKYQEDWFDTFNKVNLYHGNKYRKHGIEYSPTNKENLERCNSLISDSMKEHVCILEQSSMNSYPYTYKKGDFIIHFVTDKLNFNQILEQLNTDNLDDNFYELDDCKELLKIIKELYDPNDYSSFLEGNCMYNHFTYNKTENHKDVRNNLFKCAKNKKNCLEIGFNAGHSSMIFFNSNPTIQMICYDNLYHIYTLPCSKYLQTKYNLQLITGDSRETTFDMNRNIKYDLIHVDGAHSKELAFKDIINCRYVAHDNTILIVDDSDYTQINDVINFLISCNVLIEVEYKKLDLVENIYHRIFKYTI